MLPFQSALCCLIRSASLWRWEWTSGHRLFVMHDCMTCGCLVVCRRFGFASRAMLLCVCLSSLLFGASPTDRAPCIPSLLRLHWRWPLAVLVGYFITRLTVGRVPINCGQQTTIEVEKTKFHLSIAMLSLVIFIEQRASSRRRSAKSTECSRKH